MIAESLLDYIRQLRIAGYTDQQIIDNLLNYGYSKQQIDEAFYHLTPRQEVKHTIHLSKTTLIALISIIIIMVAGSIILFKIFEFGQETLLDISLESIKTVVKPGENINFVVEVNNLGSKKRYDVKIRYELFDSNNKVITFKEETKAVETSRTSQISLKVPQNTKNGEYKLKATVFYDEKTADSMLPVTVGEIIAESCSDGIKNQNEEGVDCGGSCKACDTCNDNLKDGDEEGIDCGGLCKACASCTNNIKDGNEEGVDCGGRCEPCQKCPSTCDDNKDCTKDYCSDDTKFECKHEIIKNCCGNLECESNEDDNNCQSDCKKPEDDIFAGLTIWETIDKIKEVAKTNPEQARKYCIDIKQNTFRDQCYLDIADIIKDTGICKDISEERFTDDCYSNIAKAKKDSQVCNLIVKSSRKDTCLMNFVIDFKDYTVCGEIANQYLKQSCESLRDLSKSQ